MPACEIAHVGRGLHADSVGNPVLNVRHRFQQSVGQALAQQPEVNRPLREDIAQDRRLVQDGYEPVLKKTCWCVLKRKENLTSTQRIRLRDILKYNLQTVRAYLLKEKFAHFWSYDSPTWAGKFLDQWIALVMRSRIEPMKKVAKTLSNHRELILNYFRAKKQFSSGVVEGLNNKVKVTMRKSYGFRTFRITEIALYHVLGKPGGGHHLPHRPCPLTRAPLPASSPEHRQPKGTR